MRHFTLEDWADFGRGVVEGERRTAMQSHLDSGCKSCAAVLSLYQRVHTIARREPAYEPPAGAVRDSEATFALHRPRETDPNRAERAKLLFDSFLQPQLAGVRSGGARVRQLLYGTGGYQIDIRIEPQEDSEKAVLVGQVLNADDVDQGLNAAHVTLFHAGRARAETMTNRFGEFRLECDLESGLQLRVRLPHGTELRVPVLEPTLAEDESKSQPSDSIEIKHILPGSKKRTRKKD
jgi:hypothetical protein